MPPREPGGAGDVGRGGMFGGRVRVLGPSSEAIVFLTLDNHLSERLRLAQRSVCVGVEMETHVKPGGKSGCGSEAVGLEQPPERHSSSF